MGKKKILKKHYLFFIFIILYLLFSIFTYKDFGIPWDEQIEYDRGKALYNFLINPENAATSKIISSPDFKNYNYFYSALLFALNKNQSYEIYHLLNMLFASILFICAYLFLYTIYKNQIYSLLGPIFLILNPQIIGHIPINPKDIPFAWLYISSLFLIFKGNQNKFSLLRLFFLGILIGFTQSFRLIGLNLHFIYLIYSYYLFFKRKDKTQKNFKNFTIKQIQKNTILLLNSLLVLILTRPYLWTNIISNLKTIVQSSTKYPWNGNVLFMGKLIPAFNLPLYYLPTMMLITTPLFVLLSIIFFLFLKKKTPSKLVIFLSITIFVNIILFLIFHPVVYDSARHYLFLSTIISILASISLVELLLHMRKSLVKIFFLGLLIIFCSNTLRQMILLHPYQYIYYNELIGGLKGASDQFETDYWATSTKEAIRWLINNKIDKKQIYTINTCGNPMSGKYYFLPNMKWTDDYLSADYYLCFTRWDVHLKVDQNAKIHTIDRDSVPLTIIYEFDR